MAKSPKYIFQEPERKATEEGINKQGIDLSNDVHPTRGQLTSWLLSVTRPVLKPLIASAFCRCLDQLIGIALFVLPIWQIVALSHPDFRAQAWPWWQSTLVMVIIALIKAILRYAEQFLGHLVAFKALELLRAEVFRRLYPQAPAIIVQSHSGDLLTRLTRDIDRIEVFFAHTFAPFVSAVVLPGVIMVWAFAVLPFNVAFLLAFLLILAVLVVPAIGFGAGLRIAASSLFYRGRLAAHLTDSIGGIQEVKGYGLEGQREREMSAFQDSLQKIASSSGLVLGLRNGLEFFLRASSVTLLLYVGLPFLVSGQLDLVSLLVAVFSMLRLWEVINGVVSFGSDLNNAFAAAGRVYRVRYAGFDLDEAALPVKKVDSFGFDVGVEEDCASSLEFQNITYSYVHRGMQGTAENASGLKEKPALEEINLVLPAGQWSTIVGVSGSGKSTLARLALRYFDPDCGLVLMDGTDIRQLPLDQLRSSISLVSPDVRLFNNTIAYNLRLAVPGATDEELWHVLERACLADEVRNFENGLDTRVGEKGAVLSGGQRQRLYLAQALLRKSKVIILDEFTSHLNPELSVKVRESVRKMLPGVTVVEITHILEHIDQSAQVAVLEKGHLIEVGDPKELLADSQSLLSWIKGRDIS